MWPEQFLSIALPAGSSGIGVFALSAVCLLQYAVSMFQRTQAAKETSRIRTEVDLLESEVLMLSRDRMATRLENQVLAEILSQPDHARAFTMLLRRFVLDTSQGFAAILRLDQPREEVYQARGLSDETARQLSLETLHLARLQAGECVELADGELRKSRLYAALNPAERNKTRRLFLVPIGLGPQLCAVLVTTQLIPAMASPEEQLELSLRLMNCIAGSMRQILLLEKSTHQLRMTREMLDLKSILDAQTDQPIDMAEKFLARLLALTGFDRAAIYLLPGDRAADGTFLVRHGEPLAGHLDARWQKHETALVQIGQHHGQAAVYRGDQLERLGVDTLVGLAVTTPLRQQSRMIGLLCLTQRGSLAPTATQLELLEWAGATLGTTLQRSLQYLEIERQARYDGLTDLANRRTFDLHLARSMQSLDQGLYHECALLLCDVDRFKKINDTYGHQAGDHVLQVVAGVLKEQAAQMRAHDHALIARYGGEEMVVLLPGVGIGGASRIAEGIRLGIEAQTIYWEGQTVRVTISVGVAVCPAHAPTGDTLIQAADTALYQAKSTGRNRTCLAQPVSHSDLATVPA